MATLQKIAKVHKCSVSLSDVLVAQPYLAYSMNEEKTKLS